MVSFYPTALCPFIKQVHSGSHTIIVWLLKGF